MQQHRVEHGSADVEDVPAVGRALRVQQARELQVHRTAHRPLVEHRQERQGKQRNKTRRR